MPTFMVVIREFKEYEFIREFEDAQEARNWAEDVMEKEPCELDGYEVSVHRLPLAMRDFEKEQP